MKINPVKKRPLCKFLCRYKFHRGLVWTLLDRCPHPGLFEPCDSPGRHRSTAQNKILLSTPENPFSFQMGLQNLALRSSIERRCLSYAGPQFISGVILTSSALFYLFTCLTPHDLLDPVVDVGL